MFFARAKQTFFTPGSAYELNLASSLLAPLHRPDAPAHPHPSALRAVERDTYASLDASRAEELFGFRARTPLREGIERTVAWYRAHAFAGDRA